jgi:hypothetical protein
MYVRIRLTAEKVIFSIKSAVAQGRERWSETAMPEPFLNFWLTENSSEVP